MTGRFVIALLIAVAAPAAARDSASVENHLIRLSPAAQTLGRTPAAAQVPVLIGLHWRNASALDQLVHDLADPHSSSYGHFLSAPAFRSRYAPRAADVMAVIRFLHVAGLRIAGVSRSRLLISAVGPGERVERALGSELLDVLDGGVLHTITASRPSLPPALGAEVIALGGGLALRAGQGVSRDAISLPLDPDAVARRYGFDGLYDAGISGDSSRGATIAIATAADFDMRDLQTFWSATAIDRAADSVGVIAIPGQPGGVAPDRVETTLDAEWATAMAPRSPVLVYAGADAAAATFLSVYDRIVSDNRAAVMTTSWGRCESDYPSTYLAQMDAILTRAVAQGITLIAAAGDQGAFACADDTAPSVSFPASHPDVLAIGGTSLQGADDDVSEVAWMGSGGGVSSHYDAPAWQMAADPMRALVDVALDADPNSGYAAYSGGAWATFGGTSIAAPIWAALIALSNQARAVQGRPALGLAAPMLCEVALASDLEAPGIIDITAGNNGAFAAAPGYDYPTGWGVPRAADLVAALSQWTPPPDGQGGLAEVISFAPDSAAIDGSARLRFQRRCLSTSFELQVRQLPAGAYTLDVDGAPVASFSPDARGTAMVAVAGVDLRGHRVGIATADGRELFGTALAADGSPVL